MNISNFAFLPAEIVGLIGSFIDIEMYPILMAVSHEFQEMCKQLFSGRNTNISYEIIIKYAATNGYLNLLSLIFNKQSDKNNSICHITAKHGHLEALKWARENGCDWNSYTCSSAAENGHLEVLEWARENGCNWNWYTCSSAAGN